MELGDGPGSRSRAGSGATSATIDRVGPLVRTLGSCALIACAIGARAAAAPACERAVRVSGDAVAAADVRERLASRGVGDATGDCEPVRAKVDRRADGLRIEVVDGSGRRSQRDVRDAATAVALIESWIAPEVVAGEDLPGAPVDTAPAPVATASGIGAAGLGVLLGPARADDASTWVMGAIEACGSIGPVCVGGRAELERDVTTANHSRQIATGSVTAQVTWRLGGFAVVPGVAVGVAWDRTTSDGGVHGTLTADDASLRVGGRIGVLRRIAGAWAIEVELAGDGAAAGPGPALYRAALGVHRGWW